MTATSTATVPTTRAPRYGKQLVSHLSRRSVGVWNEESNSGSLEMSDGTVRVAFSSTPEALLIQLNAAEADIATFEDVVGRHLVKFGAKDELRVAWQHADGTAGTTQG